MKFSLRALAAVFVFALATPLSALAADDAASFRLTAALLAKVEAIDAEARRLGLDDERESEDGDEEEEDEDVDADDNATDIDSMVRKIEADPRHRALLGRHDITARELAVAALATLHAGTYLAFEQAMDKNGAAKLLAGYTPAQRANIELLRQRSSRR